MWQISSECRSVYFQLGFIFSYARPKSEIKRLCCLESKMNCYFLNFLASVIITYQSVFNHYRGSLVDFYVTGPWPLVYVQRFTESSRTGRCTSILQVAVSSCSSLDVAFTLESLCPIVRLVFLISVVSTETSTY